MLLEQFPWNGVQVNVVPDQPRRQLSLDCPVTDDFRKETNDWMVSFFGTTNTVPDGVVYQNTTTGQLFCNPRTYELIQRAVAMQRTMTELNAKSTDLGKNFKQLPKEPMQPKPSTNKPRGRSKHFKHLPRR